MKVSGGYMYFAAGIIVLTVLTSFPGLTCPLDGGTGVVTGAVGLEIKDVESQLIESKVFDTGCAEIYSDYTYSVKVTLKNGTPVLQGGALVVKFYDPAAVAGYTDVATATRARAEEMEAGEEDVVLMEEVGKGGAIITFTKKSVAEKFIFVEVPAGSTKTIEENVQFSGFGYEEITSSGENIAHVLAVASPQQSFKCPYSRGTGKVTLPTWIRLKAGI